MLRRQWWHALTKGQQAKVQELGGTVNTDFVPFDVAEMYQFIGLLFANGLSPKPDFTNWFESAAKDKLFDCTTDE